MSDKILILGASGYMGSAMVKECEARGIEFYAAHWASDQFDFPANFQQLCDTAKPSLVVNCAAYIPTPSVDACKDKPFKTMDANVGLPNMLSECCQCFGIPLMHLSTGCLFDEQREYTEDDVPTRGWEGYCGFYIGCKRAAEQIVNKIPEHYILRLRLPFDEFDSPRNYLSKLAGFETVFPHMNSLTHRGDFAKAALDLWRLRAPWGTYHVCCKGQTHAEAVRRIMQERGMASPTYNVRGSNTTGCRLSTAKLEAVGVKVRSVESALVEALNNWKKT